MPQRPTTRIWSRSLLAALATVLLLTGAGWPALSEAKIQTEAQVFLVQVVDPATGQDVVPPIHPYGPKFRGGINVAATDVTGDGVSEIVTAPGEGARGPVRVFKADGTPLGGFFPYGKRYRGGVFVAVGDVTGDKRHEIITGAGSGAPRVNVWSYITIDYLELASFLAYDPSFRGGVHVAAGDVNGDGLAEIVTGPGPGGRPRVRAFGANGDPLSSFLPYKSRYHGGVNVAAGDLIGDGRVEVIVGPWISPNAPGGRIADLGPLLAAFASIFALVLEGTYESAAPSVSAYDSSFRGGVNVAAGDVNGDLRGDLVTGPGPGLRPLVKVFNGPKLEQTTSFLAFARRYQGGVSVAAGDVNGDKRAEIIAAPANQKPRSEKPRR